MAPPATPFSQSIITPRPVETARAAHLHDLGYVAQWIDTRLKFSGQAPDPRLRQTYRIADDAFGIVLRHEESPAGGPSVTEEFLFTSSFPVAKVWSVGPNVVYLAGTTARGNRVIERWTVLTADGALAADAATSSTSLGTPAPVPQPPSVSVTGGGPWVPPDQRTTPPSVRREETLRDDVTDPIAVMAADPEGRVLTLVTESGRLTQHALDDATLPVLLEVTAAAHPILLDVASATMVDHLDHGRSLIFPTDEDSAFLPDGTEVFAPIFVLLDHDNDGIVDLFDTIPSADVSSDAYWEPSRWHWSD